MFLILNSLHEFVRRLIDCDGACVWGPKIREQDSFVVKKEAAFVNIFLRQHAAL